MRKSPGQTFRELVVAFYQANPDEILTTEDMAVKFGVTLHTAQTLVRELRRDGVVQYLPGYVAGPAIERRRVVSA